MAPERADIIQTLRGTHLFHQLGENHLGEIVDALTVSYLAPGDVVYHQAAGADSFYIIHTGQVNAIQQRRNRPERTLATLVAGDYFGEGSLLTHAPRSATVRVVADTTLLRLDQEDFERLVKVTPNLRKNLQVAIDSHRLARRMAFPWLSEREVVYFIARKHPYFLVTSLILPVGLLVTSLITFIVMYFSVTSSMLAPFVCNGVVLAGAVLWAGWNFLDWANDFYVVTNQRVVWLERIAVLYDSRQEAPLSTILSVGVNTTQWGRMLGYGNVNIRTFTGNVIFGRVSHAEQVAALVEEQWFRAKTSSRREENKAMTQAIRQRLGIETGQLPVPPLVVPPPVRVTHRPGLFERLFGHLYTMRFEQGDTVTYRKHWYILLQQTWLPALLILLVVILLVSRLINLFDFMSPTAVMLFAVVALVPLFLWYLYEYVDWRNDIYQITPDQILDIDKKPLGKEEKKAAPLENILSIQYERLGFLGLVLNFGTVTITVGGTKFTFDYVYDPSTVQQDVFRRMAERITKTKRADTATERERISDWFASYYNVTKDAQPNALYSAFPFLQTGPENLDQDLPPDFIPLDRTDDEDQEGYMEPGDFPPAPEF